MVIHADIHPVIIGQTAAVFGAKVDKHLFCAIQHVDRIGPVGSGIGPAGCKEPGEGKAPFLIIIHRHKFKFVRHILRGREVIGAIHRDPVFCLPDGIADPACQVAEFFLQEEFNPGSVAVAIKKILGVGSTFAGRFKPDRIFGNP